MAHDFTQHDWDHNTAAAWHEILGLAVREDLDRQFDWTTVALVDVDSQGAASVVARRAGVIAGLAAVPMTLEEYDPRLTWEPAARDGSRVAAGQSLGIAHGPARSLLTAERVLLNMLGRLSGIATVAREYVDAVAGTKARIYDTRKTTPGWRLLEKYAVRQGGAHNHRTGLYDAILIKDNHLALRETATTSEHGPAEAVRDVRAFVESMLGAGSCNVLIEVEVDTLEQLAEALTADPDLILLDNFALDQLRRAVELRNQRQPRIELEASGGVNLATVRAIAETGVERISVGALTHGAAWLDVALDWVPAK